MGNRKLIGPINASNVTSEMCDQVEMLCKLGMSDEELAEFFKVPLKTIGDWYLDHAEFRASIDEGRVMQVARVADAMHQRALGFQYTEEKSHVIDGRIEVIELRKQALPDVGAQSKILAAKRPDQWGNKISSEITNPDGSLSGPPRVDLEQLSPAERELFKQMLEASMKRLEAEGK